MEFLLHRVPKGLSEADADRVAERLGDLPLALEQAGAMLSETGMPADEYLRLLEGAVTDILTEGKSPNYPTSMTAAWELSVAALKSRLPEALELLRCCAFFGPEPIPLSVFHRGTPLTSAPLAAVISDPILMASAIRELGRYALVTVDDGSVTMHRLIQALIRDELSADKQARYRHDAQLILAAAAPGNPADPQGWPDFAALIPHLTAPSMELARSQDETVRGLALNAMRYLLASDDPASCQALAEMCTSQWAEDSGPDSVDVARAKRHLGEALRQLGDNPM